jgi:hypothetical protein
MGTGRILNEQYARYFTEKNVLLQKTLRNLMPFEMHNISEI